VEELISSIIRGFPQGCVYALVAMGFVLTYKTAGVFNLAFGAQAFISAAVYYDLHVRDGWAILPAVVVAVVVVAPLLGLVLDRMLFRHMRTASQIAKLVTSIGLLVALPEIAKLLLDLDENTYGTVGIVPNGRVTYHFSDYVVNRNDLATIGTVLAATILLTVLFKFSAIGLQMRATVESPRMTELAGVNAERVGATAWMLSSLFAGLAGVLLAPLFPFLSANSYFELVVAAVAAAVLARLSSLPVAALGGLFLSIGDHALRNYLPEGSIIRQNLGPSLPFVLLFAVLVLLPALQRRREVTDPLSSVDPPPPGLASDDRGRALTIGTYVFGALVGSAFFYWIFFEANRFWLGRYTQAAIYAVLFLSIVVITGMAGQISLCQPTFAMIGALTTAQLVTRYDMSVLLAMVIGAAVTAAVGGLLSVPALRLGGIFLALATLAFALFVERVMLKFEWFGGGARSMEVPRPTIGPWDFADNRAFFVLCVVVLALTGFAVILLRNGTTGRYLDALRGSETAAAAMGVNPARARITAFAVSAALAGLAGGLLAMESGRIGEQAAQGIFNTFLGLVWIVLVVTLGARTVEGAIQGAFGFVIFPELVLKRWLEIAPTWHYVFFGLVAITFAKHPEGILEHNKRQSLNFIQRQIDRFRRSAPPSATPTVGEVLGEPVAARTGGDG